MYFINNFIAVLLLRTTIVLGYFYFYFYFYFFFLVSEVNETRKTQVSSSKVITKRNDILLYWYNVARTL